MTQSMLDAMLINAAKTGDNSKVTEALNCGADIHARNDEALCEAATYNHKETVALLLERGADIHACKDAALRDAANMGCIDTVALMLDRGANIHALDDDALRWASLNGHNVKMVALLLEHGANIHTENDVVIRNAAANGDKDMALLLLRHGADPKAKIEGGNDSFTGTKLAQWLGELRSGISTHFKSGRPTQEQCFTAGKLDVKILDACVTNQFSSLIGAPLVASSEKADRQLFQDIWNALPEHWQDQHQNIYMQFIKEGGVNPIVGPHTGSTLRGTETPDNAVGR